MFSQSPPSYGKQIAPSLLSDGAQPSSSLSQPAKRNAVFSKYLMNDIPRGTTYVKLINSLLAPPVTQLPGPAAHVQCGLVMSNSRLDEELSVAKIEFSDTPKWLQELSYDPNGFPKKSTYGTLWIRPDLVTQDAGGKTEFIRAVINGKEHMDLLYPEMLAEFDDVDINVQDALGRTALHWACEGQLENMVRLCLSVPDCDVGLKDNDGNTAFEISLRSGREIIPGIFYKSIFDLEGSDPQSALLRVLTITDPVGGMPIFPGEAMFEPIEDRNIPLVTALLNRRVDLTVRNMDGNTALHVAAAQPGSVAIVSKILEAGADVNAIGQGGATPLHASISAGEEMVEILLHWKADTTVKDTDGRTASNYAVQRRKQSVARLIECHQARDFVQQSPKLARETLVDQTVSHEAATDIMERKDRLALIGQRFVGMFSRVGLNGHQGRTALRDALDRRDVDTMEVLLELGVNTEYRDTFGRTILDVAAEIGFDAGVQILLAAGVKPNVQSYFSIPLYLASSEGHNAVVQTLLVAGANIEAVGETDKGSALQIAAWKGHNAVVKTLLAAGADIDTNQRTATPLYLASMEGHISVVETLLVAGANIEAVRETDKCTALQIASTRGHNIVVEALLVAGASIGAARGWGEGTPLHRAARGGHDAVVKTLLAAGASIDAPSGDGFTPLMDAAAGGHSAIVEALLAAGANIDALAGRKSALQVASGNGYNHTARVLRNAGAVTLLGRLRNNTLQQLGLGNTSGINKN